jgi:hypothetical protein
LTGEQPQNSIEEPEEEMDPGYRRWLHASPAQRRAMVFEEAEWKARLAADLAHQVGNFSMETFYAAQAYRYRQQIAYELAHAS